MRFDLRRGLALLVAVFAVAGVPDGAAAAQSLGSRGIPAQGIIPGVPGQLPGFPTLVQSQSGLPANPVLAPAGAPASQGPTVFDRRSLADIPGQSRGTERVGSPTQAEGGPSLVAPLGDQARVAGPATAVFGASLFTGQGRLPRMRRTRTTSWRRVTASRSRLGRGRFRVGRQIDPAGNLFLPNIGPVMVAGVRVGDLQVVEGEIRKVYTSQVQVYATVLSTQRIGVFVTGFVRAPGRYAGTASDSVLDFLGRAGNRPGRGSFREIAVNRGGRTVVTIDLYRFLLRGRCRTCACRNDTLVVGRQRAMIGADGAVRNNHLFESTSRASLTWRDLIELARPLPAATNACAARVRNAQPFSLTCRLPNCRADAAGPGHGDLRRRRRGTHHSASRSRAAGCIRRCWWRIVTSPSARSSTTSPSSPASPTPRRVLLRPALALQQKRTIDEALDRLERQLFLAPSATTSISGTLAGSALVTQYISRARRVQPRADRSGGANGQHAAAAREWRHHRGAGALQHGAGAGRWSSAGGGLAAGADDRAVLRSRRRAGRRAGRRPR